MTPMHIFVLGIYSMSSARPRSFLSNVFSDFKGTRAARSRGSRHSSCHVACQIFFLVIMYIRMPDLIPCQQIATQPTEGRHSS